MIEFDYYINIQIKSYSSSEDRKISLGNSYKLMNKKAFPEKNLNFSLEDNKYCNSAN